MTACESKSRYMGTLGAVFVIAGALSAGAPANAVDLINRDKAPREVTINGNDGVSKVLTVKPGEKVTDICNDCVILLGKSAVETRGRATVKIEGGEVSIASQR